MAVDLSGLRRYELKYTVTESQAQAIRDYIQPLFSLDRHASPQQRGYVVNNVYLDTPGLRFYYDTKFKQETRLKSRVRYYGQAPDDFVILEVKHRHNTISWKRRRQIPADEWPGVLEVSRSERTAPSYIDLPEIFEEVNHLYSTAPVLHVRYFREPYVSDIDEYGRITFDRALRYRLAHGSYEIGSRDDLEGIAYDPADATLWVVEEQHREVVHLDAKGEVLARHKLDLEGKPNSGLEGICLDSSGTVYVVNEKNPGLFVTLNADLSIASQRQLDFAEDLSGLDCGDGRFWVLSDQSRMLYRWSPDGGVTGAYPLPFDKAEGVAVDLAAGLVYIVSESEDRLYVYAIEDPE